MVSSVRTKRAKRKNTTKRRGTWFEYRIRDFLLSRGWDVFRSAGSRTCADLIAIKPGPKVLLVQCKGYENLSLTPDEKIGLIDAKERLHTKVLIICRQNHTNTLTYHTPINGEFVEIVEPKWL